MYRYKIVVDDNFHYMDEEYRYVHRELDDCASAVTVCKSIVDEFLADNYKQGMDTEELYKAYVSFGEDPWIDTADPDCERFSAWTYAKERCQQICNS